MPSAQTGRALLPGAKVQDGNANAAKAAAIVDRQEDKIVTSR